MYFIQAYNQRFKKKKIYLKVETEIRLTIKQQYGHLKKQQRIYAFSLTSESAVSRVMHCHCSPTIKYLNIASQPPTPSIPPPVSTPPPLFTHTILWRYLISPHPPVTLKTVVTRRRNSHLNVKVGINLVLLHPVSLYCILKDHNIPICQPPLPLRWVRKAMQLLLGKYGIVNCPCSSTINIYCQYANNKPITHKLKSNLFLLLFCRYIFFTFRLFCFLSYILLSCKFFIIKKLLKIIHRNSK